jgi:hypothetical protein
MSGLLIHHSHHVGSVYQRLPLRPLCVHLPEM